MDRLNILWIEEESNNALTERRAFLESNLDFRIKIIENYEDGKKEIDYHFDKYDLFLIDILLPFSNENMEMDAHGLKLVRQVVDKNLGKKCCVYSSEVWTAVNNKIGDLLTEDRFMNKTSCRSSEMLEAFIYRILKLSE